MSFRDMQIALDVRLAALTGGTPIAWDNIEYQAVTGTAHLRPTLINTESLLYCIANGAQSNEGLYRIDANYPAGRGHSALLAKLDQIYQHFKASLSLTVGTTTLWLREIAILPRIIVEGSWYMGSLDIRFINYDDAGLSPPPVGQIMWVPISTSGPVIFNTAYITTNDISRVVFDLPNVCSVGDYFRIAGYGLAGWEINAPPGISIIYGDQETTNGGTLSSINPHDCIELVCVAANSKFEELSSQGNITVT
jgi:hypothetical protein